MSSIAIIGGHGKVGLRLSRLLAEAGHDVTSWVRDPQQGADVESTGASVAVLDVEQLSAAEMTEALRGQEVVVWSAGAGGGSPARTVAVDRDAAVRSMEAAAAAGARRFVMVSYFGAGEQDLPEGDPFRVYAQAKAAADAALRGSTLEWTILGPSSLTDEPGTGMVEVGSAGSEVRASEVSRDDVAAVAAYVIDHASTVHRTIAFNAGTTPIPDALA